MSRTLYTFAHPLIKVSLSFFILLRQYHHIRPRYSRHILVRVRLVPTFLVRDSHLHLILFDAQFETWLLGVRLVFRLDQPNLGCFDHPPVVQRKVHKALPDYETSHNSFYFMNIFLSRLVHICKLRTTICAFYF